MDDITRDRKLARLRRLQVEVERLERELGVGGDPPASVPDVDEAAMDIEQGGGGDLESENGGSVTGTTSEEDTETSDGCLQLRTGPEFTGSRGGFWGTPSSSVASSHSQDLTHVTIAPNGNGMGRRAVHSVHEPIAHPNTLYCPPTNIVAACECVSGQLGLGCCVADDPVFGVGDLYQYFQDKREEAAMTSNMAREPNNVQRKHMYKYCAVKQRWHCLSVGCSTNK